MFVLGHMGVGSKLVGPWTRGLPIRAVLLGTLVPDVIDKPLFYGLRALTGTPASEATLVAGTRGFGHTALFLLAVALLAFQRRSRILAAMSLGMASHALLDNLLDVILMAGKWPGSASVALAWPLLGWRFSELPFRDAAEHLHSLANPWVLGFEAAGAAILGWDFWKRRNLGEILIAFRRNLRERRKLRRPRGRSRARRSRAAR
jgi:hypothetical protein